MKITHNNKQVEIKKVTDDFSCFVNVVGVGKRRIYEDINKQGFVKCFNKWFMFPQEIDY